MMMCEMFEPLPPLNETRRTMLAVKRFGFLVLLSNMVEHGVLLLAGLGTMRAHKLTCVVLRILCGHV